MSAPFPLYLPCDEPTIAIGSYSRPQYDYTKGQLPELIDVIIEEKASLFVCAVGVPPKWAVEKLHKAGIPVMNVRADFATAAQNTHLISPV